MMLHIDTIPDTIDRKPYTLNKESESLGKHFHWFLGLIREDMMKEEIDNEKEFYLGQH